MRPAALCLIAASLAGSSATAAAPAWRGHANDPAHMAQAPAPAQTLTAILWQTPVDLNPGAPEREPGNGGITTHYASPMITAANTVLVSVKTTAKGGFEIQAKAGATGATLWTLPTDYVVPAGAAALPSLPSHLTPQNRMVVAGAGGTVLFRDSPDSATGKSGRLVFYGAQVFKQYQSQLTNSVMVNTPITANQGGDLYFGFVAGSKNPANLQSGIARLTPGGKGIWVSAASAAGDASITEVAMSCAPALSPNGKIVYVAVSNSNAGYLLGLNATTLATLYKVALTDPSSGEPAWLSDLSSAAPTVGPDGDVYYGVLENPFPNHDNRGWLLHFDAKLATPKTPGSFGWDDTASVVPASAVPSYTGKSSYLLMTKYNNYLGIGPYGNGENKLAILDPNGQQKDQYSKPPVTVMKEVETILNPVHDPDGGAKAVYEWCPNTAVIDVAGSAVFAGSEDGNFYRWNLLANTLDQSLPLNAPTTQAYTPSVIGPDGTVYGMNAAVLFAIGR